MICCRLRQTALPGTLAAGSLLTPASGHVSDVIELQGSEKKIVVLIVCLPTYFLGFLPLCVIYPYFRTYPSPHSEKSLILKLFCNPFHNHSF